MFCLEHDKIIYSFCNEQSFAESVPRMSPIRDNMEGELYTYDIFNAELFAGPIKMNAVPSFQTGETSVSRHNGAPIEVPS